MEKETPVGYGAEESQKENTCIDSLHFFAEKLKRATYEFLDLMKP